MATIKGIKAGTTTITASYTIGGVTKTASISNFKVNAIAPTLTFSASNSTLTYTGSKQNIGTVSYNGDGTAYYIVSTTNSVPADSASGWTSITNGGTIQSSAATATTYYVFLKSSAGTNYTAISPKSGGNKAIGKATVTITSAPSLVSTALKYTGSAQTLVNTGTCSTGGTMYYYVSTTSTTPTFSTSTWKTTPDKGTNVGTYYVWYYCYVSDTTNYSNGTDVGVVKSLGSKEIGKRTGASPTFNTSPVTATCVQSGESVNTSAFTAATAGHSGNISYTLRSAKNSGGTSLDGWGLTTTTSRIISIPENTIAGTYTVVIRATEDATTTDTSSTKDATITVTLNKGTQTLTLDKTTLSLTVPNTGTIKASGYAGTLSVSSDKTSVATCFLKSSITSNSAESIITAKTAGTATITFTATATDYVESVSKTATVTVSRRTGAAPTFNASTVTATCSQDQTAKTTSAFTAATAGHSGTISYSLVSAKNSAGTTLSDWTVNSSARTIGIPANTVAGTYTVVVKATEAHTSTDTSSTKDATITVTLNKGTQTLTITGNPTNYTTVYSNGGTITASGHVGTISATSATTSVATVSTTGSVVTVTCKKAGTSVITVTAGETDYVNSVSKTATWTINKASRSGAVSCDDVVYGSEVTATVSGNTENGVITWGITNDTGSATIDSNGKITPSSVGTVIVTAQVAATTNYSAYTATSKKITITQRTITVTAPTRTNRTYTGNSQTIFTAGSCSVGGTMYYSETNTAFSTSTWSTTIPYTKKTNAGTYTIYWYCYVQEPENNVGTNINTINSLSATISKAASVLPTTLQGDSVTYHDPERPIAQLTVSGHSGGTLKYRYDTSNGTNWTETTTAPTREIVGNTAVQVMVVGDANHNNSSWSTTVTLTVNPADDASMVVTLSSNLTYNGNAQVLATGSNVHGISSYTLGYRKDSEATADSQVTWGTTNSSIISGTNVGTYYIYYKFSPDSNHNNTKTYTLVGTVSITSQGVTSVVNCNNTTYPTTVTATLSSNPGNGTITWGIENGTGKATINSSGVVTPTQAGTVTITASVTASGNYSAFTATPKTITIGKAEGTITYSTVSEVSTYCTTDPTPSSTTVGNKTLTIATSGASGNTGTVSYSIDKSGWSVSSDGKTITIPANTAAGTYSVKVTATSAASTNYNAKSVTNTVSVIILEQALVRIELTVGTNTISYNSTTTAIVTAVYSSGATSDVSNDTNTTYSSNPTGIVTVTK